MFILGSLLQVLEEGAAATLVLHLQERLGALRILRGQLCKAMPHTFRSCITAVEREAQREVGVGGPEMQVDQDVDGGLQLGGIILTNLGAHSCWAIRS